MLLSDTIGFISKLPPYMIEAFKSTLAELNFADIILLVIDFSDDMLIFKRKLKSSQEILSKLEIPTRKILLVLNKSDLLEKFEVKEKLRHLNIDESMHQIICISSKNGYNISNLTKKIDEMLSKSPQIDQ